MRTPFPQPIIKLVGATNLVSIPFVEQTFLGEIRSFRTFIMHQGKIYTLVRWEDEVAHCRGCTVREHVALMEYARSFPAGKGTTENQEEEKGEGRIGE